MMKNLHARNDNSFDLTDVLRTDNLKTMHLNFMGKIHRIEIERMDVDFDNLPDLWVVLDGGVRKIFGEKYHPCLCDFFRKLESRCGHETKFPVRDILLSEIFECIDSNEAMVNLVNEIVSKNKIENN